MPNLFLYITIAVIGVIFGSFANVVILRDNNRTSIVKGRSACPYCHHTLQWYELIPLLSFFIQGAKCRSCKHALSWQYPLGEAAMGTLFVLAFFLTGTNFLVGAFLAASLFFFFVVTVIDWRTQMIPVEYVLIGGALGGVSYLLHGGQWVDLVWGAIAGGGLLAGVRILWKLVMHQDGMGEGDLWFGLGLGLLCGYPVILVTLVTAVMAGAVGGIIVMLLTKKGAETAVPFGPFLFLGSLVALMWGQQLIAWYTVISGITSL
jgi:prepilin signal peptidase PulO-like enzyme (type II secretory pathway)